MKALLPSTVVQLLLMPALFYAGAKLSLALAVMPEALVMLWLPNGVLLAALLHFGWQRFGYFAAAIVVAEIAADYATFSLLEAVLFAAINLGEAALAYALLTRWRFNPRLAGPADLAKFLAAGPLIAAALAALAAAGMHVYFRDSGIGFVEFAGVWWLSDGLGLLIVTPLVLSLWPTSASRDPGPPLQWYDALAVSLALGAIVAVLLADTGVFQGVRVRPVLLLPFALYAAARLTTRATTLVLVAFSSVILFVAKNGQQPFGDLPIRETVLQAQQLIFIMTVSSLGLATLLAQLRTKTREVEARVRQRTAALHVANEQLLKLAVTDPLTGLFNRRALLDLMRREMERHRRHGHPLAVIIFDIDRFKQVNDKHGHAAGDAVLQQVSDAVRKITRGVDTLARYGGEEFVLVAIETSAPQALQLAERIREALRAMPVMLNHHSLHITASFGVAMQREDDANPDALLRRADAALYAAKAAGRDRVMTESSVMAIA